MRVREGDEGPYEGEGVLGGGRLDERVRVSSSISLRICYEYNLN